MHIRRARSSDNEAIRAIYNTEVVGSTATFDLVPRTPDEQVIWLAEHSGPYPAVVAVDEDDRRPRLRFAVGVPGPARLLHHGGEFGLCGRRPPGGRGWVGC